MPGHGKLEKPTQIMKENFVIKVTSGSDHLVCLTNEGLIYTLGMWQCIVQIESSGMFCLLLLSRECNPGPDRFANPGISGLSLLNPGIPGLNRARLWLAIAGL